MKGMGPLDSEDFILCDISLSQSGLQFALKVQE